MVASPTSLRFLVLSTKGVSHHQHLMRICLVLVKIGERCSPVVMHGPKRRQSNSLVANVKLDGGWGSVIEDSFGEPTLCLSDFQTKAQTEVFAMWSEVIIMNWS